MKEDYDLYYKDSGSVNKGRYVEGNESVSISSSHDYTTHWRRGWDPNPRVCTKIFVVLGAHGFSPLQVENVHWKCMCAAH